MQSIDQLSIHALVSLDFIQEDSGDPVMFVLDPGVLFLVVGDVVCLHLVHD